jgi:hypothetical protein
MFCGGFIYILDTEYKMGSDLMAWLFHHRPSRLFKHDITWMRISPIFLQSLQTREETDIKNFAADASYRILM